MKRTILSLVVLIVVAVGVTWPGAAAQRQPAAPRPQPVASQPRAIERHLAVPAWRIDPAGSEARFTVTKLGFQDVTGVFRESDGTILYDPARLESSSINWRVHVASVLTDASNRDRSLQGPEYFDAGRHPHLSFVSRSVRAGEAGVIEVAGDISIRGVTRPLNVIVHPRATATGPVFETDFDIDRYDFGVVGGSVLGRFISARVRVHLRAATVTH